jgi:hypothetical protein
VLPVNVADQELGFIGAAAKQVDYPARRAGLEPVNDRVVKNVFDVQRRGQADGAPFADHVALLFFGM